jgi:hypothetical protein
MGSGPVRAASSGPQVNPVSFGPQVYVGRVLVVSSQNVGSGTCPAQLQQGSSYGVILRTPSAAPKHWKMEILSDEFAVRVGKIDPTQAQATIFNGDGTLTTTPIAIKSGGLVQTVPFPSGYGLSQAAELSVTVKIPGVCQVGFFAVASE